MMGLPIDGTDLMALVIMFGLILVAYCLPSIIAFARRHRNRWVILIINFAFGVTGLGWIIALVWSLNKVDDPVKGGVKIGPPPPDPIF
jgi:uncharacterized membrane protein YhaH (DUF805 family)